MANVHGKANRSVVAIMAAALLTGAMTPIPALHAEPRSRSASADTSKKSLAESLTGGARSDYDSARLLFSDGDFPGALAKLQSAYDQSKDPRLLWNMAACEKNLRHYYRVQLLLQQYLREGHAKALLTPQNQTDAAQLLETIRAFVGMLRIESNEAEASVFVDDQKVATTPVAELVPVDLGTRRLVVTKPGFADYTQTLTIAGGAEVPVHITMAPGGARLTINAAIDDTVAIDGKVVGAGRYETSLAPGTHTVRVTSDSKKPFETQLNLLPGSTRTMDVTLEGNKSKTTWPWIVGGAAVVAAAGVAGYLLLRPGTEHEPELAGSAGTYRLP